jgi:glycosyltransferase involved in cell wall biosynthesis
VKIIQLTYSLGNGGAEKFVVELSNALSVEHEVVLCTYKPNKPWMLPPEKLYAKVRNISLNIGSKKSLSNWNEAYKLIKDEKPDVVHVHASLVAFYMLLFPLFFRKVRFIHTIHNTLTPAYEKLFRHFSVFQLAGRKWINVCISKNIFELFSSRYRCLSFVHIDNGIDAQSPNNINNLETEICAIKKNNEAKLLIAVGNFSDYKRFDLLMEVMNYFYTKKNPLYLILLGEDKSPGQNNYHKVMNMKNENVHVLGLKRNVADYMAFSDALIMSSSMEGMPLVILEAMSLGKPVISAPAGGVIDMIKNHVNGFLAADLSKEALIKAVMEFINASAEKIEQIGKNNLLDFEQKYSIANCMKNYLNIYSKN